MTKQRHLAPTKKYFVTREPKKNTKVLLLLKDDLKPYLSKAQRESLLLDVGDQYKAAKKKEQNENMPKITMSVAAVQVMEGKITNEQFIKGIEEGWILVS
jgi:hypothetical protein